MGGVLKYKRFFFLFFIIILIVFSLAASTPIYASTITVNTLIDENDKSCSDGDCSLRDAIYKARPGDTINFNVTGKIILTLGTINIGKNLAISGPGPYNLIIDGNNNGYIFWISGLNVSLSGMTITHARGYGGGAIINDLGTLYLFSIVLKDNVAYGGESGGVP